MQNLPAEPDYSKGFVSVRRRAREDGLQRLAARESIASRLTLAQVGLIEGNAPYELADPAHPGFEPE